MTVEHKPVWCDTCSPLALTGDNGAFYWKKNIWEHCQACEDMCEVCMESLDAETAASGPVFRACLRTVAALQEEVIYKEGPGVTVNLEKFEGGGQRSSDEGKPRFDMLFVSDMPYNEQVITKAAFRMGEGAKVYGARNFEKMKDTDAFERAKSSLLRHVMQYITGEEDEDHLAAVICNAVILSSIERHV